MVDMQCRCCEHKISDLSLLVLHNMPLGAQNFPEEFDLLNEKGIDLRLYQCDMCGVIQLSGEPVPYYRDVIRAVGVSKEMKNFREKQFPKWIEENQLSQKKIVEVGCGCGEYLSIMKKYCPQAVGLENNEKSVKCCNDNSLRVYEGYIDKDNYVIPEAPYDGFYILSFLEHFPSPHEMFKGLLANLTDNAVGLIEVPNFDMIIKYSMYSELIQDHLLYFTQESLCRFLSMHGFEVVKCKTVWHDYIISVEVKRRQRLSLDAFKCKQAQIKQKLDDFFAHHEEKHIAVWGAGHQALTNMALLEMEKYVEVVIDSANFKQNKFTPATHIPIYSPESLSKGNIDVVLIMAGSYSQEIASYMKENYPDISSYVLTNNGDVL
ncbi:class I SAM-dependent methyltransferase [Selenomonas ruminantium]|nr:class I SAM-dependent methyltransferase [Selenomonas ruminantium]